ncbi:MAG TPA: hypothetical protein DEF83_13310 [Brucella melitensis]|nr:hypothetical protein [Brucella melitensis]HBW76168.1 hypothetical protein [Brucella melitensis]HBX04156.1 hypothetical protein [Brucella melitensis]
MPHRNARPAIRPGVSLSVFTHYPTHRSGARNQPSRLISPRRRFPLLARKCSIGLNLTFESGLLHMLFQTSNSKNPLDTYTY